MEEKVGCEIEIEAYKYRLCDHRVGTDKRFDKLSGACVDERSVDGQRHAYSELLRRRVPYVPAVDLRVNAQVRVLTTELERAYYSDKSDRNDIHWEPGVFFSFHSRLAFLTCHKWIRVDHARTSCSATSSTCIALYLQATSTCWFYRRFPSTVY